ncbi:MAG: TIGR02206 family membrane protein [Oscillospiraceae bacterium]|nr:TIGR02206 family membrane protein [Oscillospiraceae bacterium]
MNEFWYTSQTMRKLKGETFRSFELFSPTHLFWLGVTLICVILAFTWFKKQNEKVKRKEYVTLTVLMLIDEVLKYIVTVATGQFEWQFLPFHLCSVNLFVCLWNTLKPNKVAKSILYAMSLPGALIALLTPAWMPLPLLNFMHLHSATVHIMLLLYPILLLVDGFRPDIRDLPKVALFLAAVALLAMGLNAMWGTNFLFLARTDNNPMLNLIANVCGNLYQVGLLVLVLVVWVLMFLPWEIGKKKKKA